MRCVPARLRSATRAFCAVDSDARCASAARGVGLDLSEQPAIDAAHRAHAGGAAAIEQRRPAAGRDRTTAARAAASKRTSAFSASCARGVVKRGEQLARLRRGRRRRSRRSAAGPRPAGRRGRARASSRTSRRMFVSCSATPRSSASSSAAATVERHGLGGCAPAEDRQADAPDRAGDAAAVDDELVDLLVGDPVDIHAHALDQLAERARRQREALMRVCQRDDHGVVCACGAERRLQRAQAPAASRRAARAFARASGRRRRCRRCAVRRRRPRTSRGDAGRRSRRMP